MEKLDKIKNGHPDSKREKKIDPRSKTTACLRKSL